MGLLYLYLYSSCVRPIYLLLVTEYTMGMAHLKIMALQITHASNQQPTRCLYGEKKRCKITLYIQFYLRAKKLYVSTVYSHHQTDHRTANKNAIKLQGRDLVLH